MMVFQVRDTRTDPSAADQNLGGTVLPVGDRAQFPADRCTWKYIEDSIVGIEDNTGYNPATGQYTLREVWFYPGDRAAVRLTNANTNVTLGHIGKSGRYIPMTAEQIS